MTDIFFFIFFFFVDVQPGQTVVICLPVRSTPLSQKRLYASFPITATLILRKKPISKYSKDVRIVPVFDASKCYDVLLVTCKEIGIKEFQGWDYLFQLAGLAYAPWDIHRYKRLTAAPELSWVGRAAFIVLPAFKNTITAKEFINQDLVTHFQKYDNTSIIIVGGEAKDLSHCLYSYADPIASTDANISCLKGSKYRLDHCLELLLPKESSSPTNFLNEATGSKAVTNRVTPGSVEENNQALNNKTRKRTVDACMLYNESLQASDPGRRSHQAVVDFNKPRWTFVNSICGSNVLPHVEFHRSCIPADADLLTVKNVYKQEGHITGGGLPFTVYAQGDDLLFMPRPEPIYLSNPWGSTFFGILSGLPAWIITKLMVGNDFVHSLKFHVSVTKKSRFGTSSCLHTSIPQHDIDFVDVLYGILHDKISR